MKKGDVVLHKSSNQKMVLVTEPTDDFVKCRYQSIVTGLYEVQEFALIELIEFKTNYEN